VGTLNSNNQVVMFSKKPFCTTYLLLILLVLCNKTFKSLQSNFNFYQFVELIVIRNTNLSTFAIKRSSNYCRQLKNKLDEISAKVSEM